MNAKIRAKNLFKLNFAARIFFIFFVLLLSTQIVSSWLVYQAAKNEAKDRVRQQLDVANRIFKQEFSNREVYLRNSVNIVARDWAFRRAVGEGDTETVKNVIESFGQRIQSDIAIYASLEGDIITTTVDLSSSTTNRLVSILNLGIERFILSVHNEIYLAFVSTVYSPGPSALLVMGFKLDNDLAKYFKNITSLEMNFVVESAEENRIAATTLDEEMLALEEINLTKLSNYQQEHNQYSLDSGVMRVVQNLGSTGEGALFVVQQASVSELIQEYQKWWVEVFFFFCGALVVLGAIALILSKSITQPIRGLLSVTQKMTAGDYQQEIQVHRDDEVGQLAKEFQIMQSAIKMREQEILFRAERSPLCGLHNREKFVEILNQKITLDNPSFVGVIVVNIKRFKDVNDTLGHQLGDKMLMSIGQRLEEFYEFDTLAHLGADQFGIFCISDSLQSLNQFIDGTHKIFEKTFHLEGLDLSLSANIGVCVYPQHSDVGHSLVRLAEVAMYQAKEQHTDVAIYDSSKDIHSVKQLTLMGELPEAIKNGNLILHYQPVLDLSGDRHQVAKVECLVRWIHPKFGFIPPDEFISLAEQTGQITYLTHWVLETAIAQIAESTKRGYDLRFAVNLSAVDLLKGDLHNVIPKLLEKHGVTSKNLVLEITESSVVQDPENAINTLNALRDLGMSLSIDDYGTGYSSLSQLKHLPVHELKIDKSFVLNLPQEEDDAVIVRSTINLGHTMGLKIVAEGVENEATLSFLHDAGCDYAQGFFISRPIAGDQCFTWLNETEYEVKTLIHAEQKNLD